MKKDRILINKTMIPYSFNIVLGSVLFHITVHYNQNHDFFTLKIEKDGETICEGEPLVYGKTLFSDIYVSGKYPAVDIVPLDESGQEVAVTSANLGETVFLTIDNAGGESA